MRNRTELARFEPFSEENRAFIKTEEALSLLLFEYAKRAFYDSGEKVVGNKIPFPTTKPKVVEQAIERAFSDRETIPAGLLIAHKYKKLAKVVERIKKEETKGYSSQLLWGGERYADTDEEFFRKMALVDHVLVPLKRYEEAREQLLAARRYDSALEVSSNISLEKVVETCEEIRGLFEKGLKIIEGNAPLEDRLKKSHVASYINGTNRDTEKRIYRWREAIDKAKSYGFSGAEVEDIRRKALDSMIENLKAQLEVKSKIPARDFVHQHDIDNSYNWASSFAKLLVFEDEKAKYQTKLLDTLYGGGDLGHAFTLAVEAGFYDRAFAISEEAKSFREEVETKVLEHLDETKVKNYILLHPNVNSSLDLAKRFHLGIWLLREYEQRGEFGKAAQASGRFGDRGKTKELLIKAGNFGYATTYTEDRQEKINLYIEEGREQIKQMQENPNSRHNSDKMNSAFYNFRKSIELAKEFQDLKQALGTAASVAGILLEHRLYRELVLFGRELGMDNVGSKIPDDAVVEYERNLDFASCSLISEAQGRTEESATYHALASYFGQEMPSLER